MSGVLARALPWAGLAAGSAAWTFATLVNYAQAPLACGEGRATAPALSVAMILLSLAGAGLSFWSGRAAADDPGASPRRFVARLGAGAGVVFALATASQLAATLLIDPCLR